MVRSVGLLLLISIQMFTFTVPLHAEHSGKKDTLIFLHYNNKGFAYDQEGTLKGPMVQYVNTITKSAGIEIHWAKSIHPYTQVFSQRPNYCSYAIVKTPEREGKAHFTDTVGEVHQFAVIKRRDDKRFKTITNFADLIKQPDLTIGVIKNNSYGSYIDTLLKNHAQQIMQSVTMKRLFYMTQNGKIDYFLVTHTNALDLLKSPSFNTSLESVTNLQDLNAQKIEFSIACSINTDPSFIKRLNRAIHQTPRVKLH